MKIVNEAVLDCFRGPGHCEYCKQYVQVRHPDHYIAKGMGGGSQLDHPYNLTSLCPSCHQKRHDGNILRYDLLALIAAREGLLQDQVLATLYELLRRKK